MLVTILNKYKSWVRTVVGVAHTLPYPCLDGPHHLVIPLFVPPYSPVSVGTPVYPTPFTTKHCLHPYTVNTPETTTVSLQAFKATERPFFFLLSYQRLRQYASVWRRWEVCLKKFFLYFLVVVYVRTVAVVVVVDVGGVAGERVRLGGWPLGCGSVSTLRFKWKTWPIWLATRGQFEFDGWTDRGVHRPRDR